MGDGTGVGGEGIGDLSIDRYSKYQHHFLLQKCVSLCKVHEKAKMEVFWNILDHLDVINLFLSKVYPFEDGFGFHLIRNWKNKLRPTLERLYEERQKVVPVLELKFYFKQLDELYNPLNTFHDAFWSDFVSSPHYWMRPKLNIEAIWEDFASVTHVDFSKEQQKEFEKFENMFWNFLEQYQG